MSTPNVFNKSMFFCVRGTIIEVPIVERTDPHKLAHSTVAQGPRYDLAPQSEWIADYAGNVYKNRLKDADHIKEFLLSSRENVIRVDNVQEAVKTVELVVNTVINFTEYNKLKQKGLQAN